jgi:predicted aspartyl protease
MRALVFVSLLAGCSLGTPSICRLQTVSDVPVTLAHGSIEVPGAINHSRAQFMVDTGAERTVLSTTAVKNYLLAHSERSITHLSGLGGMVSHADVYADLQLGDAHFQQRLAEADIPQGAGLLGADMLSDYDVEFDLPNGRFRLWRAPGCNAADIPWSGPRSTLAINVTDSEELSLVVVVNGIRLDAILDSGSTVTLMTTDAARRLGVAQTELAYDPEVLVHGVGSGTIALRLHRFNSINVGGDQIASMQIGVGEFQIRTLDMILGLDYLRQHKVWVSYRTREISIQ